MSRVTIENGPGYYVDHATGEVWRSKPEHAGKPFAELRHPDDFVFVGLTDQAAEGNMSIETRDTPPARPLAEGEWLGFRCPHCGRAQPALSAEGKPLDRGAEFTCEECDQTSVLTNRNTGREKG